VPRIAPHVTTTASIRKLPKWDSAAGRRLLRDIASGKLSVRAAARKTALEADEIGEISRSLRRVRPKPRKWKAADVKWWSRSIATELDHMRDVRRQRELALERFEQKGFHGNEKHLRLLLESVADQSDSTPWNRWRQRHPRVRPDLRGARLTGLDLRFMNLRKVRFIGGDLSGSILRMTHLEGADLRRVHMRHTDLSFALLHGADMRQAVLEETLLATAELNGADLRGAALIGCMMNGAILYGVKLKDAVVWGTAIWHASADERSEEFFVSNQELDPIDYDLNWVKKPGNHLKLDKLELAHFLALVSDNDKIGELLRAAATRLVLLLGRFTGDQAEVLDQLRKVLPRYGYAPIVFDFEQDAGRDLIETVTTLAGLSRFIIADLTAARSTPLEAQAIVPDLAVPFVPIIQGESPFSMFDALRRKYFWVLDPFEYRGTAHLISSLKRSVIGPAERMLARLRALKEPAEL